MTFTKDKNSTDDMSSRLVSDLVAEDPRRAAVFEQLGVEYCCQGKIPLEEACKDLKLDLYDVITKLNQATAEVEYVRNWTKASVQELIDDIVLTHHSYLRSELPRISVLATKVAKAHGETDPRLLEAKEITLKMVQELREHTDEEEQNVFPICTKIAEGEMDSVNLDSIREELDELVQEHHEAADALDSLRELTDSFIPPENACPTWRTWLDSIARLEQDLHRHVHKENHVLFPKVRKELDKISA